MTVALSSATQVQPKAEPKPVHSYSAKVKMLAKVAIAAVAGAAIAGIAFVYLHSVRRAEDLELYREAEKQVKNNLLTRFNNTFQIEGLKKKIAEGLQKQFPKVASYRIQAAVSKAVHVHLCEEICQTAEVPPMARERLTQQIMRSPERIAHAPKEEEILKNAI